MFQMFIVTITIYTCYIILHVSKNCQLAQGKVQNKNKTVTFFHKIVFSYYQITLQYILLIYCVFEAIIATMIIILVYQKELNKTSIMDQ